MITRAVVRCCTRHLERAEHVNYRKAGVRRARWIILLTCAAGCCTTFSVNECTVAADAHAKPMDTAFRLYSTLRKRLLEDSRCDSRPAGSMTIILMIAVGCCCLIASCDCAAAAAVS